MPMHSTSELLDDMLSIEGSCKPAYFTSNSVLKAKVPGQFEVVRPVLDRFLIL